MDTEISALCPAHPGNSSHNSSHISPTTKFYLDHVFGPLLMTCCLLGIIFSIINIIVLTRPAMRGPISVILTAIAVVNILDFYSFFSYAAYWHVAKNKPYKCHTEVMAKVTAIGRYGRDTALGINLWLTVLLGFVQYTCVCQHFWRTKMYSSRKAVVSTLLTILFIILIRIPDFVTLKAVSLNQLAKESPERFNFSSLLKEDSDCYVTPISDCPTVGLVVYNVILVMLPCLCLVVLSTLILVHVKRADHRRRVLFGSTRIAYAQMREQRSTSVMLLAIIVCTIVFVEWPSAMLIVATFLNKDSPRTFEDELRFLTDPSLRAYSQRFTPLIAIMPVFNSAVNFIIYCNMSRKFRTTFMRILTCKPTVSLEFQSTGRGLVRKVANGNVIKGSFHHHSIIKKTISLYSRSSTKSRSSCSRPPIVEATDL